MTAERAGPTRAHIEATLTEILRGLPPPDDGMGPEPCAGCVSSVLLLRALLDAPPAAPPREPCDHVWVTDGINPTQCCKCGEPSFPPPQPRPAHCQRAPNCLLAFGHMGACQTPAESAIAPPIVREFNPGTAGGVDPAIAPDALTRGGPRDPVAMWFDRAINAQGLADDYWRELAATRAATGDDALCEHEGEPCEEGTCCLCGEGYASRNEGEDDAPFLCDPCAQGEVQKQRATIVYWRTEYRMMSGDKERAIARAEAAEARLAEAERDAARLHWLHSQESCALDADGCEWGIWRVKWEQGRPAKVWATLSDFSDLDAAIAARKPNAAQDAP